MSSRIHIQCKTLDSFETHKLRVTEKLKSPRSTKSIDNSILAQVCIQQNLLQTFFWIVSQVKLVKWVSVLNRWVWKHCVIILHWNWHSLTVMLFHVQSVLSDSFSLWNHILCLTFCSDCNIFFHTRRCTSTTGRRRAFSFGNHCIKTDCTFLYVAVFTLVQAELFYWDCLSTVWHVSSWHKCKILNCFFVRIVQSSICYVYNSQLFLNCEQLAFRIFHDPHYFVNSLS